MDVYVTDVQVSDKLHSPGVFHGKLTLRSASLRTFTTVVPIQKTSEGRPGEEGQSFKNHRIYLFPGQLARKYIKRGEINRVNEHSKFRLIFSWL